MKFEQAYAALRFEPAVPVWVIWALAGLCVVVLAPAVWRRARGWAWRGLAFAVLLGWLAGPRLVQETRDALPDIGLLVVDKTASMRVGERGAIRDRAVAALQEQAARLPDLEMRVVEVPEGGRDGTALFAAVERALADIPRARLSGIIALSDGQVHDQPTSALPAPLHLLIPAKGEEIDRRLRIVEAPGYGIVGHDAVIRLSVDDLGTAGGGVARLVVRRDGEASQVQSVVVGQETSVAVPITRAGPTVVELQVDGLAGEVSGLNNRAVVAINGVRDRLRVLLVSGEPNMGERTWRRLLKADPAVDLVHFTILRPPERDDFTPTNELSLIAFPVRELFQVKIRDFDLIILDRFSNRNNILPPLYLRNIADYVRAGGALLLSAGPEFAGSASLAMTNLGSVLPVRGPQGVVDGPFRPLVTAAGERHPVTEGLPGWVAGKPEWGDWYRYIAVSQNGGQSGAQEGDGEALLSAGDGAPLLVLDRVGDGRVALLLSDQIWLWSRGHEGGGPQQELLRRIAHWAMKEPALEEEALRARVEHDRLTVEKQSVAEGAQAATATVTSPSGVVTTLALGVVRPGLWRGEMAAEEPGVWQVGDGARSVYAASLDTNPRELLDLRATASVLAPVLKASGGSAHFIASGAGASGAGASGAGASGAGASGAGASGAGASGAGASGAGASGAGASGAGASGAGASGAGASGAGASGAGASGAGASGAGASGAGASGAGASGAGASGAGASGAGASGAGGAERLPELRRVEAGREASGGGWIGLPRRHDHVVTGVASVPLLPPWGALPLLVGLMLVAWRREGSG